MKDNYMERIKNLAKMYSDAEVSKKIPPRAYDRIINEIVQDSGKTKKQILSMINDEIKKIPALTT
jgi:hypothetical protein